MAVVPQSFASSGATHGYQPRAIGWVLLIALQVVAIGSVQTQPLFAGALADLRGLTLQQIGLLFSLELITAAVVCTLVANVVHRCDRRLLLRVGLVAVLTGTVANVFGADFTRIAASRTLVGVGLGIVQAVLYATIASTRNAERGFAIVSAGSLFWGPPAFIASSFVLQRYGMTAFLMQFVGMAALSLLMSRLIPQRAEGLADGAAKGAHETAPVLRDPAAIMVLLTIGLVMLGHQALWVYQERVGRLINLSPDFIGTALAGALIFGGLGSVVAAIVGSRMGRVWPQLIGFGGSIVATLTMVYGTGATAYVISACAVMGVWFFGLPFLLAMAAELDGSGRISALSASAMSFGQALAPVAAAAVVGDANYRAVGWFASVVYVVCLLFVALTLQQMRRRSSSSTSAAGSPQPVA